MSKGDMMSKGDGLQVDDVIQLLSLLADDAKLRVTVKESLKGGLLAGAGALLGGLIGGKTGLLLGGIAGAFGAMAVTDDFESVGSILINMDRISKEKLFAKVQECFNKASIDDIGKLNEAIKDPDMKAKLLKVVIDHVESQLEMNIVD